MRKTLKEYRVDSEKSKMQYAQELGIPYTTYCRYEENLANAPFDVVVRICKHLNISISEIAC